MSTYIQNRVAVSRFTLPTVMVYAVAVWLFSGVLTPTLPIDFAAWRQGAWVQFAGFLLSVFLMVVLNNKHALIRGYSRTVSCSFAVLTCAASFQFSSVGGAAFQLCWIAFFMAFFHTYQNKTAVGQSYYAFLFVGLSSCLFVQTLYFVPVLWVLMFFQLSSLCWRTFWASIFGLLTPYWFALPLLFRDGNAEALLAHLAALADFQQPFTGAASITVNELLFFVFVVALGVTGTVHYQRKKLGDNIHVRLLYDCFITLWIAAAAFLVLQPQHYDMLIRLMVVSVSPLIAHFLTLTSTRMTNIAFRVICAVALLMTLFNLWMPSLPF